MNSTTIKELLKEHSAWVAGAGFVLLAVTQYLNGDTTAALHDAMLALACFGLKSGIEKIWNGLPDDPTTAPPAAPAAK